MDEKFCFGLVLGMLGGALVATNSQKARSAVKEGQETVAKKLGELQEEKPKKSAKSGK